MHLAERDVEGGGDGFDRLLSRDGGDPHSGAPVVGLEGCVEAVGAEDALEQARRALGEAPRALPSLDLSDEPNLAAVELGTPTEESGEGGDVEDAHQSEHAPVPS